MAKTNIELILEMKDRYSKVLKKADTQTQNTTKSIKERFAGIKERYKELTDRIAQNTETSVSNIKRYFNDRSFRRASIIDAYAQLRVSIKQAKKTFDEAYEDAQKKIPVFGQAVEFLKNPITLGVSGLVGVGTQIKNAADLAMNWQKGMAEINVTAGLSQKELDGLSKKMLEIGSQNVAPLEEVPGAFNKIISAGLDAKTALASLDPTLKAAKAGFVDIETVAKAGTSVMNSAGVKDIVAEKDIVDATGKVITRKGEVMKTAIEQVYDTLFATMQKGSASMSEIAAYLPTIVPTAKNAGISLNQASGAFAFMTAQGVNAASAATLLNGAFNSLSNPKLLANFKAIGVNIYDAKGKMRSMPEIVDALSKSLDGLSDKQKAAKLASLGLDQTSAQAFAVMTQSAGKFRDTLDATAKSEGALKDSYNNSLTARDQWGIAANNIKKFMIQAGQFMLPVITKMGEWAASLTGNIVPAIKGVKNFLSEWSPVILGAAAAFLVLNANTIAASAALAAHSVWTGILAAKQWIFNVAMSANPIGLIIVGIGILIGSIVMLCKKYEGWTSVWNFVKTFLVNSFWQFVDDWKDGFQGLWYYIQLFWLNIKSFGQYIGQLFSNIGQAIKLALTGNFSDAKKMLTSEIHTDAENEIEKLKAEREQQKAKYATETKQRIDETQKAWNDVHLTKKETKSETEGSEDKSVSDEIKDMLGGSTDGGSSSASSGGGSSSVIGSADAVAGSAKQIKNITVNIDAFNKGGINAGNTQGLNGKSATDIDEWFTQMLLRTIRNLEMSY
ncbi:MAG: phage tail tape measure protein [Bacteroidales bacterium]|nr:phage tail tape measure protein [Bacteroidales bacterium]